MPHPLAETTLLRVYYTRPVTGPCGCCGAVRRMGIVDLDRHCALCRDCLPASVQAAEALRAAGLVPPDNALTERDP